MKSNMLAHVCFATQCTVYNELGSHRRPHMNAKQVWFTEEIHWWNLSIKLLNRHENLSRVHDCNIFQWFNGYEFYKPPNHE